MSTESKAKYSVGVSVLITANRHLLLGRRINTGTADGLLSTPGGRIEMDENMFDAAVRETWEETGIVLKQSDLLQVGFKEHFRFDKHYFMFYFWATISRDRTIVTMEPNKCEEWKWIHFDTVMRLDDCTEPREILKSVNLLAR